MIRIASPLPVDTFVISLHGTEMFVVHDEILLPVLH